LLLLAILISSFLPFTRAQVRDSVYILIQQYEFQKAINYMDQGVSDPELLELKAIALSGLNKYQEAARVYEELYELDTGNLKIITELADCYQSYSDYDRAKETFLKALQISPRNNYLFQQMAGVLYQDNDYREAIFYYTRAYTMDSTFFLSRQLGRCYDNLGTTDTAIYFYRKALDLNPLDIQTAYRLAEVYKQKEEYETAVMITRAYLLIDSLNLKMLKLNGYLNLVLENFQEAVNSFEKCILLRDTSDFTNTYLGYSYFNTEEFEKAKFFLEKAFQHDTTNIELCYALGLSCDHSVYKKLGIYYLNKTIELATPSPEFLSRVYQDLAAAYTGYYKYEEGLQAYFKALGLNPDDTLLIFKIASQYDNWIKDKEKALEYYRLFLETRPEKEKPMAPKPEPFGIIVSYYDYAERRIGELKEDIFWEGD